MLDSEKYLNKKIAIYGMGLTGCSAAKSFNKLKAKVICWDDNPKIRKKAKKLNLSISKFWKNEKIIDHILISPGININKCKINKYLKKNFHKIITDLDLFFEFNRKSLIISITGTNGKSTTCKIIEKILKSASYNVKVVGNIGNPILSSKNNNKKNIFIIEVSSYQLQYSKLFNSSHAAILNISSDHLERHKNMKNYIRAKSKIFIDQKKDDYTYISKTNKYSKEIKKNFYKNKVKSKLVLVSNSNCRLLLKKIKNNYFRSKGNIENLSFAYKIAKNLKIKDSIIINAINRFKGLPHRQEVVISNKKILCINDSKATSFESSLQALSNNNNIYWIVGGLHKQGDNFNLNNVKTKIIRAYIIGRKISFFKNKIEKKIPYVISNNLNNAINQVYKDIKKIKNVKNTILFSPAAASFDQFNNFENRGNYFKKLILRKFKGKLYV